MKGSRARLRRTPVLQQGVGETSFRVPHHPPEGGGGGPPSPLLLPTCEAPWDLGCVMCALYLLIWFPLPAGALAGAACARAGIAATREGRAERAGARRPQVASEAAAARDAIVRAALPSSADEAPATD